MSASERPVALVSGGNRGIGLAAVGGLARAGMQVVMGARDLAAGERARAPGVSDSGSVLLGSARSRSPRAPGVQLPAQGWLGWRGANMLLPV
jgi:NAD(P)-dependent dehydrogenase (short-subunit alcohol dehydrogenase family)